MLATVPKLVVLARHKASAKPRCSTRPEAALFLLTACPDHTARLWGSLPPVPTRLACAPIRAVFRGAVVKKKDPGG